MTLDKRDNIEIPQWVLSLLVSIIGAVFVFWGLWSSAKTKLELKAERNEKEIETLRLEKVSKSEFTLVLDRLISIENKLDDHTKDGR